MRANIAAGIITILLIVAVVACGSDSNDGGNNPMGPDNPDPPVESPAGSINLELLWALLHDPYSVVGLSWELLDQERAEGMRQQAALLSTDLQEEDIASFAEHLQGLHQMDVEYVSDPEFDSRDLPTIAGIQLYVDESTAAFEGSTDWILGLEQVSE